MIRFLLKGLLRDRSRSSFPVLIVSAGVMLTVFLHAWLNGTILNVTQSTAQFKTGYVNVMTKAYAARADQIPNDLALLGVDTLLASLKQQFPDLLWAPRIMFGGLLDIPDEKGETKEQTPVSGLGVDLFSPNSPEWTILNIRSALVRGHLPEKQGELLIADELAQRLNIQPGQKATLISSTMYGSMALENFTIAGMLRFGVGPMDRSAVIADLSDIRQALDMQNGAGEILGFFRDNLYHEERANAITAEFNAEYPSNDPENGAGKFSPIMETLRTQSGLSEVLDIMAVYMRIIIGVFVFAMSVVLWNAGLTGSLRRYGEFGLRLAVGENKGHVYRSLIVESLAVGVAGSCIGTAIGLAFSYYLQVHGIDISGAMPKENAMMIPDVVRAQIEPATFVIGFLPGILATFFGSAIAGIGMYKRQTAQLFKELET
ncbi:MAG: FtsX-like permease family protein [Bacteroidota bacterium]|nr:FtsX-like permease family protein [Bacteroidota bacterium]